MKKIYLWLAVLLSTSAAIPAEAVEWYLEGTLGFEWSLAADYSDADSAAKNPPALFGTGPGRDGRQIGAYGDFGRFPSVEVAVGIRIFPWLRSELAVAHGPDMHYRGQANFRGVPGDQPVSASVDSLSGMANCFLDIAPMFGFSMGSFQPYMGGGAGVVQNRLSEMTYDFPGNPGKHKIPSLLGTKTDAFYGCLGTGIVIFRPHSLGSHTGIRTSAKCIRMHERLT